MKWIHQKRWVLETDSNIKFRTLDQAAAWSEANPGQSHVFKEETYCIFSIRDQDNSRL